MIKSLLMALVICGAFPFVCAFITHWTTDNRNDPLGLGSLFVFIGTGIVAFIALVISTLVIIFSHVDKADLPPPTPEKPQEKITAPAVPEEKPLSEFGKWLTTPLINPKDVNTLPKE